MDEALYNQFYSVTTHQELAELVRSLGGVIYKDGIVMGNPSSDEILRTHYDCWMSIGDDDLRLYAYVEDLTTLGGRPVMFSISVQYVSKLPDD